MKICVALKVLTMFGAILPLFQGDILNFLSEIIKEYLDVSYG